MAAPTPDPESNSKRPRRLPSTDCSPGAVIRAQLDRIGVDQNDAAPRLGIDKKTLNLICRGKARLTPKVAVQIEKFLWLDARELLILQIDCDLKSLRENTKIEDA
jgi:addiction module HigA family antidote